MTEGYLQVLIESLEKKDDLLDKILELDQKQFKLLTESPTNMEAIDESMDVKGKYIEELEKLDDGFATTFEIIRDEVKSNPSAYSEYIKRLQELIRSTVDKSVSVNVLEKRNKSAVDMVFQRKRTEIRQVKKSSAVASRYYKEMSRIDNINPQLMDRKK